MKKGEVINVIESFGNRKKSIIGKVLPFSLDRNFQNKH